MRIEKEKLEEKGISKEDGRDVEEVIRKNMRIEKEKSDVLPCTF